MKKVELVTELDAATKENLCCVKSKDLGSPRLVLVANEEEKVKFEDKLLNKFLYSKATAEISHWRRQQLEKSKDLDNEEWQEDQRKAP